MSKKIIGVTVGTPISPSKLGREIKPVKTVNSITPDGNGNVQLTHSNVGAAPSGYGLGIRHNEKFINSVDEIINFKECGWYTITGRTTLTLNGIAFNSCGLRVDLIHADYCQQTLTFLDGTFATRRVNVSANTDTGWEFINPPMQYGVEYRTTERFLGKPVYTMLIDLGETPVGTPEQKTDKEVILIVNGITRVIGYEFYFNSGNKDHPGLIYTFKGSDKTDSFMFWSYAWPDHHSLKIGLGSRTEEVFTAYAIVKYLK